MTPNRRKVLKTLGTGVAGGVTFAGSATASPGSNFGYVETGSDLEGKTVDLVGTPSRHKVFCDAGGSESRIKTEVWDTSAGEPLYLIPSGYGAGDTVGVGSVFTECTRNPVIKGEVSVTLQ